MPERPGDPPQPARPQTDRERAEAARLREIGRRAPPAPAIAPPFPANAPWSTGLADLAHLWLDVRCACGAHSSLPFRYLAAVHGWKTPLSDVVGRLRCAKCGERPASVDLLDNPMLGASGVPSSGKGNRLRLKQA